MTEGRARQKAGNLDDAPVSGRALVVSGYSRQDSGVCRLLCILVNVLVNVLVDVGNQLNVRRNAMVADDASM